MYQKLLISNGTSYLTQIFHCSLCLEKMNYLELEVIFGYMMSFMNRINIFNEYH